MNISFDLITEKWIPCQWINGDFEHLGLEDILTRSHEIKTLVTDLPMEKVSIFRLLLAILHRNFGPQSTNEWQDLWKRQKFNGQILGDYFENWRGRFNLFDEKYPFYQTREIDAVVRPLNGYSFHIAVYHMASGNNATLFDHHTIDDDICLTPAEAARLIINAQSFAFGFRSYKDGPSARGVNFLLIGSNLFQTLMLNFIRYDQENPFYIQEEDKPAWERENAFSPERTKPDGYLDYLTWQSRKILLFPEENTNNVRSLQVDNGMKLDVSDEPFTKNPMMQYSRVEKPGRGAAPYRPLKFQEGRSIWRDSTSIIETNLENNYPPKALNWVNELELDLPNIRLNSIGISSDQGKVNFYLEENFVFPAVFLEKQELVGVLKTCLELAEAVRSKLWGSVNRMAEIMLSPDADREHGRKSAAADKQNLIEHIFAEDQFWARLEVPFYQLLNDMPVIRDDALKQWHDALQRSVWRSFEYAGNYLGNSPEALKARALGGRILGGGLKELFGEKE